MRQSVDGVTQIVERASPGPSGGVGRLRVKFYWSDALVWFMRAIAWLWVAKGLFNWGLVLGAFTRYGDFAVLPRSLQGSIIFFATVDLLAAVGLWLAAPWGGVLWLLCASIETVSPALGVRGAATDLLSVGLNVTLVALYFLLTWRAGHERA
jgi:uncharacterized membrane protein YphA (DoxX/SURF4 family)